MKNLFLTFFALLISSSWLMSQPTTKEAFAKEWKQAINSKDQAAIEKLTYLHGLTKEEINDFVSRMLANYSTLGEFGEVTFEPLPDDLQTVMIGNGKKSELLGKPIGLIKMVSKNKDHGTRKMARPYTVVDGKWYAVGTKITTLDWKGPPDVAWNIFVHGKGSENVVIEYGWNASGIDLTRKIQRSSNGVIGQHINCVKVTCNDPNAELVLELLQGDKDFYKSKPLKGIGVIEYKK